MLGGEFKCDYGMVGQFSGSGFIGNSSEDYRTITQLEAELGVGWRNDEGNIRLTVGYLSSAWLNTINTDSYIQSVHNGTLSGIEDTLTFGGLVVRAELRR